MKNLRLMAGAAMIAAMAMGSMALSMTDSEDDTNIDSGGADDITVGGESLDTVGVETNEADEVDEDNDEVDEDNDED